MLMNHLRSLFFLGRFQIPATRWGFCSEYPASGAGEPKGVTAKVAAPFLFPVLKLIMSKEKTRTY